MTARGLVVVIVTLIIAGCASVAPKGPTVEGGAQIKWRQHHAQVARLDQWDISGRIGVRTANTGGSANLRWKFDKDIDQIDLFGPFGGGRIRLDIDPDGARLRSALQIPTPYSNNRTNRYREPGATAGSGAHRGRTLFASVSQP